MKEVLNSLYWQELEKEGITRDDLDLVMLEIEYSPVIPMKGSKPMEAIKLENGMYRVPDCPIVGLNIPEDQFKVMRYRYLINR